MRYRLSAATSSLSSSHSGSGPRKTRLLILAVAVLVLAALAALAGVRFFGTSHPPGAPLVNEAVGPTAPTRICGQPILNSPFRYDGPAKTFKTSGTPGLPTFGMAGTDFPKATKIVVIPAGNNTAAAFNGAYEANRTIFYFEPGTHIVQQGMYAGDSSVYIGGYTAAVGRAIIDGVNGGAPHGVGGHALAGSPPGVVNADDTWEYLTIRNYAASENNVVMGDEDGAAFDSGNTYKYNTIGPNEYGWAGDNVKPNHGQSSGGGYAIGMVSNTSIEYNCLTMNAQGAFNGGGVNDVISHNEISWNGLGEYPDSPGTGGSPYSCGCSGGGKLFFSVNAVITYNYVHDNYNTGIWLDFDNVGANISHNYVASNWGGGIAYEASYNAVIEDNTLVGNGWASNGAWPEGVGGGTCNGGVSCTNGLGPITGRGGGFPYAAIGLSNSGGTTNLSTIILPNCKSNCVMHSKYRGQLLVEGNVLRNNFGGVMVYTDTDRYPGNIDNDSACSVPLGALNEANNATYYQQTEELQTNSDATVSGTSVTSSGGTKTLCSNYGERQATGGGGGQEIVTKAPSVGMAVFNVNTGKLVGTVASVKSAHAFTLEKAAAYVTHARLLLSAYGGCGPADYYGGRAGVKSGNPSAYYWDNCIWGSRNVTVSGNTFDMQSASVQGCITTNMCGYMLAMAFNAGVPPLVQYFDAYSTLIARDAGGLGNIWSHNTYSWTGSGAWQFMAGLQGNKISRAQWQNASYNQDAGSKFSG
jgi:parallel beta-helix repeat protein